MISEGDKGYFGKAHALSMKVKREMPSAEQLKFIIQTNDDKSSVVVTSND